MNILIASATSHEIAPILTQLKKLKRHNIQICYTGVGMLNTAIALMQAINTHKPKLIIQAGIAGSFNATIILGDVYVIANEYYGDLGVLENGAWHDIFDMNLATANVGPYTNKAICNNNIDEYNLLKLPVVNAVTVNAITTDKKIITELIKKYTPQLESMEGIALHHAGLTTNTPFLQLRAVSNYIGDRNKQQWKMEEAIINLNEKLFQLLEKLPT